MVQVYSSLTVTASIKSGIISGYILYVFGAPSGSRTPHQRIMSPLL